MIYSVIKLARLAGDPQTAVGHLGDVVLFLQWVIATYQASQDSRSRHCAPDICFTSVVAQVLIHLGTEGRRAGHCEKCGCPAARGSTR